MGRIVVMIVGNNAFSRSGIRHELSEQGDAQVFEAIECELGHEGSQAMAAIAKSTPDIVLIDMGFPHLNELRLSRNIARHFPGTKVVVLSANPKDDDEELFEVIKTGAAAYLRASERTGPSLAETIEMASRGEYPINDTMFSRPSVSTRVLRQFQDIASMGKSLQDATAALTPREVQVLTLISEGNSNKLIAGILGTSEQTIKNCVSVMLRKLNANDRAHAVFIAARDGLITTQETAASWPGGEARTQQPTYATALGKHPALARLLPRSDSHHAIPRR
jgi:two-component system response regulator DegU